MILAILSWRSHQTLINSLETYKKYGLDTLSEDKVIFFQEITKEDRAIAKEYGYDCFGSPTNIGIAEAYKLLVAYASDDLFLFLENDWELIEAPHVQLSEARELLLLDTIDVARFRHRKNPGAPLWSRQYEGNPYAAPQFLLDSVFWDENPERMVEIKKLDYWYITTAQYANWTNNPTMFRTDWLREVIVPRMEGDIEIALQGWWQQQEGIRVGQSDGLFTHNRLDR
jgi:hypothetical protein